MTRIVHCPGCKALLVEPTTGVAIYQCGNCSMVLVAKHARSSLASHQNAAPLYKQRERQPVALPSPGPSPRPPFDASVPPLYTPRNGNAAANGRLSSAAAPPSPPAPPGIEDTSSVLLQDMRKLAREAFPVPQEQEGSANSKTDGRNGRITGQEPDEFTFPSQAYDLDVRSDYHSTREELDSSAQSDELRRNCYFERLQLEDPTATANGCNAATRRRNSSSSSDALGGHGENQQQREKDEMAIVAVTNPEPDPARKKKIYPPLKSPYVVCQYCHKLLEVPGDLPPSRSGIQKLRCGACQNVSKFTLVNHGQTRLDMANSCDSTDTSRNNSNSDVIDHKRKMNVGLSMASSVSSRCGSPGSAPASFHPHHPGAHHHQRMSSNSNNKGYDSAPELQHDASASTSSGHARTISAGSSSTVPLAPCLHELFGYDTPSQFFKVGDKKSTGSSSSSEPLSQKPRAQGLKGLLFKSIHDISKLHFQQPHYTGVTINGRVVPEELVRKAEEQAGPIHPGSYWYDYRAGFWGVMGGPCVGIVPPCIDAFKFPAMPVNCAGGKTKVLVNGRELHQQDLQVLVKRGLPATPNVAYTIDVEGVVVEDATKNEVTCLGKLAPSIEKRGVGFGMFPLLT